MKRDLLLLAGALSALSICVSAWADSEGQGNARSRMCEGCHGIPDYRTAYPEVYPVPRIGGQQAAYIVKALQDYKTGARKHESMRAIAATLSDQEIADLAAYYAEGARKRTSR